MPPLFYPDAPLPAHLEHWERLDLHNNTAHLVDEPWRHFEPYLASRGYTLCWRYYSRQKPETPVRTKSFDYPVAPDPFHPGDGEGFVHLYENTNQSCGIHQTTGWLTQVGQYTSFSSQLRFLLQCSSLKMAYDSQDRVVTVFNCIRMC